MLNLILKFFFNLLLNTFKSINYSAKTVPLLYILKFSSKTKSDNLVRELAGDNFGLQIGIESEDSSIVISYTPP